MPAGSFIEGDASRATSGEAAKVHFRASNAHCFASRGGAYGQRWSRLARLGRERYLTTPLSVARREYGPRFEPVLLGWQSPSGVRLGTGTERGADRQACSKVIPSRGEIPWFFVGASRPSGRQECHSSEPEASQANLWTARALDMRTWGEALQAGTPFVPFNTPITESMRTGQETIRASEESIGACHNPYGEAGIRLISTGRTWGRVVGMIPPFSMTMR